jgi:preprotein translocase subunit SecE
LTAARQTGVLLFYLESLSATDLYKKQWVTRNKMKKTFVVVYILVILAEIMTNKA